MEVKKINFLQSYSSILLLLSGIIVGSILGLVFGEKVEVIKPLGDIFLNLLFTAIIPLIFFTITSSIANLEKTEKLGKLFIIMVAIFLATILISAIVMTLAVYLFPIHQNIIISKVPIENITVYGLPMEQALPVAMILGTLVDPIATLLNVNGDLICSMMISRFSEKTKF